MRRWFERLATASILGYPLVLALVILLFRFVGERWWASSVGLFLPRIGFGLPLLVLGPLLIWGKVRRLWWAELLGLLLLLFPLMGLALPQVSSAGGGPSLRVMSYNVNSSYGGVDAVVREIVARRSDVVMLQESADWSGIAERLRKHYPVVEESTQFVLATRGKLVSTMEPERLAYDGRERSPRFVRYEVDTALGRVVFYNVHPLSPRESFSQVRGKGLREEIRSGRLFFGAHASEVDGNSGLRMLQVRTFAAMSRKERGPTVVLGDTNQPGLTALYESELGEFGDAFRQASWGFGYTYPSRWPWMRLDRVLLSKQLRGLGFETGCGEVSDHRCVIADVGLAPGAVAR